ncbi:hypothetical protein [Arthrobacter sp. YAF16]|uniref:hypothetical protein n=1 Tax=Arthrobacter sp. YAF16 TaxID=3233076 RepID=UPI003F8E11B3
MEVWGKEGVWPTGLGGTDALANHLRETGIVYARRALEQYCSWDSIQLLDAAVAIGSSVELLAKAMLADVSPVLLQERSDDWRSALLFAGVAHPRGKKMDSLLVRSLSASQATKRLKALGLINAWSDADDAVFTVRNAASHMGLVDAETLQDAVVIMVRFCDAAREYFKRDVESWWGVENAELAVRLLTDAEERLAILVGALFSTARQVLARRQQGVPRELQEALFSSLADARPSISSDPSDVTARLLCPVCGLEGWAVGFPGLRFPGDQAELAMARQEVMEVESFQCHVCGLLLAGEEVAEGGLPGRLRFDLRDPS